MMSRILSSRPRLTRTRPFTQSTATTRAIFNASDKNLSTKGQSKIRRWIFGMIIGSAPFFFILICWILVSLCINNLVRFYQRRKNRYRHGTRTNGVEDVISKLDI